MNRLEYESIMWNSEVPHAQRVLYSYLRGNADYRTGIVGDSDKKRISYQGIREALEYSRSVGSRTVPEKYSKQRIFKQISALEKRGVVVALEGETAMPGRRQTIRKFLPLAVGGSVRPQEVVYHLGDHVGYPQSDAGQGIAGIEGNEVGDEVVYTSVCTLSLNNKYIYFEPDDSDFAWLRYQFGADVLDRMVERRINLEIETEMFNLRNRSKPEYDMRAQREDWRGWILRALQYRKLV